MAGELRRHGVMRCENFGLLRESWRDEKSAQKKRKEMPDVPGTGSEHEQPPKPELVRFPLSAREYTVPPPPCVKQKIVYSYVRVVLMIPGGANGDFPHANGGGHSSNRKLVACQKKSALYILSSESYSCTNFMRRSSSGEYGKENIGTC